MKEKEKAARRWVSAVNQLGTHGTWDYIRVTDPSKMGQLLNNYTDSKSDEEQFEMS